MSAQPAPSQEQPERKRRRRGRGEGSVYQRKDGLWEGRISLGYDAKGRRIRPTVQGKTKREVLEQLRQLQQDHMMGLPVKPEDITLSSHLETWLIEKRDSLKPSTLAKYQAHAKHIRNPEHGIGHLRLNDLTYQHIIKFYERLEKQAKLSKRTIFDISTTLRAALTDAVRKKVLRENPALLVSRSKGETEATFMTPEQLRAVLQAARGERIYDALVVLANTGLRPGEWLGLSWDDVDLQAGTITVRQALHEHQGTDESDDDEGPGHVMYLGPVKTKASRRTIKLPQAAVDALKRWRRTQAEERLAAGPRWVESQRKIAENVLPGFAAKTNLVFTNRVGGFMSRNHVLRRDLRRILNRAAVILAAQRLGVDPDETARLNGPNLPTSTPVEAGYQIVLPDGRQAQLEEQDLLTGVTLHTFRHTHASMLIARKVDIKTISKRLGHERITITYDLYGHLLPGMDEEAADCMDEFMASI